MLVLALDTSADIAVALVRDGATIAARRAVEQRRHAELLAPLVVEALAEARLEAAAIEAVVVGTGPAPFTGLRAGLVTARTVAWSLGVPVLGVCSLDAYAAMAYDGGTDRDTEVLVVTDARRREVYAARYRSDGPDGDVVVVDGPAVLHAATLAADPSTARAVVVGPGAGLYPDDLTAAPGAPTVLDPAVLARLAVLRAAAGRDQPTAPLYLRRPDVMPSGSRKRATG